MYLLPGLFCNLFCDKKYDETYSKVRFLTLRTRQEAEMNIHLTCFLLLVIFSLIRKHLNYRNIFTQIFKEHFYLRDKFKSQFLSLTYFQQSLFFWKKKYKENKS